MSRLPGQVGDGRGCWFSCWFWFWVKEPDTADSGSTVSHFLKPDWYCPIAAWNPDLHPPVPSHGEDMETGTLSVKAQTVNVMPGLAYAFPPLYYLVAAVSDIFTLNGERVIEMHLNGGLTVAAGAVALSPQN